MTVSFEAGRCHFTLESRSAAPELLPAAMAGKEVHSTAKLVQRMPRFIDLPKSAC